MLIMNNAILFLFLGDRITPANSRNYLDYSNYLHDLCKLFTNSKW